MSHSVEIRAGTIRRTEIRSSWWTRHKHVWPIANTRHENRWETTKLSCRHLDKSKPEKLVNGKTHRERLNRKWLEPKWLRRREGGRGRERRKSWFSMTSGREGSGMVPEMWDKPLWKGVCPYLDRGKVVELGPCIPAETGWRECPSDSDSSPELRDMWMYGCPKSPVWSSGGDEFAGSEGTSSFEDYEHNVDNLAL